MSCDTPQFLLSGGVTDCGLCLSCCKAKSDAERQRRFLWMMKNRRNAHV